MKLFVLICSLLVSIAPAYADVNTGIYNSSIPTQNKDADNGKQVTVSVDPKLKSPRETYKTFIDAMTQVIAGKKEQRAQAIATLDLSAISPLILQEKGEETTQLLFSLLQLQGLPKSKNISRKTSGTSYTLRHFKPGSVSLTRDKIGNWRFSQQTVADLPDLYDRIASKSNLKKSNKNTADLPLNIRLKALIPAWLKGKLLLEYWQWLGLFLIIVIGSIADRLLAWVLRQNVIRWQKKNPSYTQLDNTLLRPLGLMAMAIIWWVGIGSLGLPDTALLILLVAVKVLVSLSGIWSAFRVVDIFDALMMKKAADTANKFDDLLVPMISKSMKVFVIVIGIIFAADNLNIDVTSLLAGLGLGGLAFALAAKDLLGNLFGSVTVLLDRPFHIGDWVIIGDVEGTVEEVGFRSTRIRTFYHSLITLPNSLLTTTKIDNMGERRYRRMSTKLGLTYDTPVDKIDAFCEGIRQLVQLHPFMRKDYYQVYFNQYSPTALEVLVYVFWEAPDWNVELRERHSFLLDILTLARQLGVKFAFPTQTLHLHRDDADHEQADPFQPGMTQQDAFALGKKTAQSIVATASGSDK